MHDTHVMLSQRRITALISVWRSFYAEHTLDDIPLMQSQRVMTILLWFANAV